MQSNVNKMKSYLRKFTITYGSLFQTYLDTNSIQIATIFNSKDENGVQRP